MESGYSNEISYQKTLPGARLLQITAVTGGKYMLTVTGPAYGLCIGAAKAWVR